MVKSFPLYSFSPSAWQASTYLSKPLMPPALEGTQPVRLFARVPLLQTFPAALSSETLPAPWLLPLFVGFLVSTRVHVTVAPQSMFVE